MNLQYQNIILDTFQASSSSNPSIGLYVWELSQCNSSSVNRIGLIRSLEDVVKIQVGNFHFPLLKTLIPQTTASNGLNGLTLTTSIYNNIVGDDFNYPSPLTPLAYDRITLSIGETSNQSVSLPNGNRYNFEFELVNKSPVFAPTSYIEASPLNFGLMNEVEMSKPINLNQITLRFLNPDAPINLFNTFYYISITCRMDYPGYPLTLDYPGIQDGDLIQLYGFVSPSEEVNNYVNREGGLIVHLMTQTDSGIPIPSANQFYTFIPRITMTGPIFDSPFDYSTFKSQVRVFVKKNRIRIPVKFTQLTQRKY